MEHTVLPWECNCGVWRTDVDKVEKGCILPSVTAFCHVEPCKTESGTRYEWWVTFFPKDFAPEQYGSSWDEHRAMKTAEETAHATLGLPYEW